MGVRAETAAERDPSRPGSSTMPTELSIDELRVLLDRGGTQLIEVLPEQEYSEEHLAGAINIPLKSLSADAISLLDPARPTVVYCWNDI